MKASTIVLLGALGTVIVLMVCFVIFVGTVV